MSHKDSQIESDNLWYSILVYLESLNYISSEYTWNFSAFTTDLDYSNPIPLIIPFTNWDTLPHMEPPYFNKLTLCQMLILLTPNT